MQALSDIRVAINGNGPQGLKGKRGQVTALFQNHFRVVLADGSDHWLLPTQVEFYWHHWTTRWVRFPTPPKVTPFPPLPEHHINQDGFFDLEETLTLF